MSNGVIQGCSFSVLIMLAEASNWCISIHKQANVEVGAFYDDRILWAIGDDRELQMRKAFRATHQYDYDAWMALERWRETDL